MKTIFFFDLGLWIGSALALWMYIRGAAQSGLTRRQRAFHALLWLPRFVLGPAWHAVRSWWR